MNRQVPFYQYRVYPHLVKLLGDPAPIREIRRQIISWAEGTVLEIGVGAGANLPHYNPARISKLFALEPNPGMIRLAERQRRRTNLNIEFLDLPGERIPLGPGTIDVVVSTFTLCTIEPVVDAIRGLGHVLRPSGRLIFCELGGCPDPAIRRWQERWEPLFQSVFQGLRLTRDIPSLITQGGFQIEQLDMGYLSRFPKFSSYCWWGSARSTRIRATS